MKKAVFTLAILLFAGIITDALAQHRAPHAPRPHHHSRVDGARMHRAHGYTPHRVTRAEKNKIREQSANVRMAKKMARADGYVTRREHQIIAAENRKLNRTIARAKRY